MGSRSKVVYPQGYDKKNNKGESKVMVEGVVSRTSAKPWNGKTFYSFALNGQEGWYNLGMKRPPAEGTSVRFEYKVNSKGYKDVDGPIEIRTDGAVEPAPSVTQFQNVGGKSNWGSSSTGGAAGAYWDRKEARDIRNDDLRELGATRNTAIAIIDLMIKNEAIKLPAVAKREGFLWDVLDRYVNKLRGIGEITDKPATEETKLGSNQVKSNEPENDPNLDGWN